MPRGLREVLSRLQRCEYIMFILSFVINDKCLICVYHRPQQDYSKVGGLSYVSFNHGNKGDYVSCYFSPMVHN